MTVRSCGVAAIGIDVVDDANANANGHCHHHHHHYHRQEPLPLAGPRSPSYWQTWAASDPRRRRQPIGASPANSGLLSSRRRRGVPTSSHCHTARGAEDTPFRRLSSVTHVGVLKLHHGIPPVGMSRSTANTALTSASGFADAPRAQHFRQKRRQVARACDGCRTQRIKCDNNQPCSNCKSRGRHCSNNDATREGSSLSQACGEIERLRKRVQELEEKLDEATAVKSDQQLATPSSMAPSPIVASESIDGNQDGNPKKKFWEGVELRPARAPHATWFGPSSLYFFIKHLSVRLSASLHLTHSDDQILLKSVSSMNLLEGPGAPSEDQITPAVDEAKAQMTEADLTPTQEEYFINLFWQSYHTSLFAIIDEAEFKQHYQSLWMTSGNARKPSALVDIVLAMCMQYAISTLPVSEQGNIAGSTDATIAGRWLYRRCQKLLTYEMDSPSISTLQCHLLCAIYLCGGSFHNMVGTSSGLAVSIAYILGLHLEPPQDMPEREQEQRRRLWWAVALLDSKTSMKLGRPFLLHDSYTMPRLPSDSPQAAMLSGSTFAPLGDNATWLSFNLHNIKLYMAVRKAQTAFYDTDFGLRDGQIILDDYQALETCAELLLPHMKYLEEWVNGVPNALKTKRHNDGCPFSTDCSALEIEQFAPLWLQRQRLLLELTYHHLCVDLYRFFISLDSVSTSSLLVESMATACAAHAIALTKIANQVLSSTSILDGCATITLVGFVFTYPQGLSTPLARNAIDLSAAVFDNFGAKFAVAVGAANIVRDLCLKVDFLAMQNQSQRASNREEAPITNYRESHEQVFLDNNSSMANLGNIDAGFYDMTYGSNEDLMDVALSVDFWGDLDTLWPNAGI
ncbi:hypothetical protein BP6252_03949 [Coleophoma cylindrospora]|uniref:Zn(2)-C6 fungal-type domain-containing protein n=1 Tax=Coleophoma cylindrospora TaxID=1849047 RepID=A0A3D8S904_9HELO|nr:hypothetical protein BP6252_03949 [Coleophoma cylindrospora]